MRRFSLARFLAILMKEFIQMLRDRTTFAMMIGIPVMQLLLFGYAINTDPHHLPTLAEINDDSPLARAIVAGMETSDYFTFLGPISGEREAEAALSSGKASFVIVIPPGFERDVIRGARPEILIAADASDPTAVGSAVGALSGIVERAIAQTLTGPLAVAEASPGPFSVVVHRKYNPERRTSLNIVPGLLAIILAMTMTAITSVAIVREVERGTMETLISTPARPFEVMMGKILPYVLVGYIETVLFLLAAMTLFSVPFTGSVAAFLVGFNIYIVINLAIGFMVSTVARTQMQAMQISFFTILPTILLSGFIFPFAGMPGWARAIGSVLPATHFLRIVRKVMLKFGGFAEIRQDLAALAVIAVIVTILSLLRYRRTLD